MEKEKRYLRIYEQVKEDIIKGTYPVGTKLPSKRVMADAMGMSVITVEHAYELLSDEGYIVPKQKSGYYVSFDDSDIYTGVESVAPIAPRRREPAPEQSVSNEPVFSYSIYAKTVRKVLAEFEEYLMQKSPKNGMFELRSAIAWYLLRSRRLKVSPDQIIIGAGAEYLYGLIVQTFGRDVLYGVESPSYQKIAKVYSAGGARLKMLRLGNDGIESDELWNSNVQILHITPYRSFPSGVTASASKKREYLRWSRKNGGYIIEDDFESEFTPSRKPEETIFSLDEEGRVIYVNTFTRTIGSYARCAYMVLPENLIGEFADKTGFYECPVPTLDQLVIASLIDSGDFERHINKVRRYNRNK
ncbi:MocR-like pyridoxine biosynthesis transcription factor PdxR [Butyrivibrio sp. NC2007]|uniref:MocR-like pyridoxine biosynthesis transcription factor PdxR n=1 Tax=Butyrivibrio sp. NC2007 TaxID=1280683 RepID=UPI0003B66E2E|nr:PLP-dependent aminotransferase family protein [Butyrivibrio sp. NC2007]